LPIISAKIRAAESNGETTALKDMHRNHTPTTPELAVAPRKSMNAIPYSKETVRAITRAASMALLLLIAAEG
jgi:hypothetical protein